MAEINGVMPNPKLGKLYEGIQISRKHQADFILAVSGESVFDYSKALAVSIQCEENPWEKYFIKFEEPDCEIIPLGGILNMVGTGYEMNAGSVITNPVTKQEISHVFANEEVMPRFSILNPEFTYSLPHYQMVADI